MESQQTSRRWSAHWWTRSVAVALTVILLSLLGLLDGIDRWAYERIAALSGTEWMQTQLPDGVANGETDTLVAEPTQQQDFLPRVPSAVTIALIAAAALTAVWITAQFRPVVALSLVATLAVCYGLLILATHWVLELSAVFFTLTLGYGVSAAEAAVQARGQRRFVQQLFSRHVPPDLAEAIWRRREQFLPGGRLHSQKLTATVLFADMRGFTALSETLDAKALMEWVSEYMETMARLIMDHGGVVDEYFGDALKANFGVPFARTNSDEITRDASQGVTCALAMGETLQVLNRRWHNRGFPRIDIRVGVSTGEVVALCIGRTQPLKFTTMGDVVQLAGQLERFPQEPDDPALGPGSCRILIGATTAANLSKRFWLHQIGTVSLGGVHPPTAVYRLYGKSDRQIFKTVADLRTSSRIEMMTPVILTHGAQATGLTSNISVGGMAVCRLAQPLPIGATAMLRFEVPGHTQPIKATGTVIWTHQDRAGIAFAALPPSDHITLETYLTRQASKKSL
ncbi:MAG: Adenylate cyclase [Nitrospira sp.]|nr:MAG: Adenylate cyclase [Nitrospira sp.]